MPPPLDPNPMKHARRRRVPTRNLSRQKLLAGVADVVSALAVLAAQTDEPVEIAGVAPGVLEQLVQHELADATGVLGRDFLVADEAFDDLLSSGDPADASAGREDFGKGVEAHDAAVSIEAEEGGGEGGEEGGVRRGRRGGDGGGGVGVHLEEIVGFVFEDVDVVFPRNAVNFFSPLPTLCRARWVLARGNGVEKPGSLGASVRCGVPGAENVVHA